MAFADATAVTVTTLPTRTATSIASGTLTAVDGTNGNKFVANRDTILRVVNGSGGSLTVTVNTNYTVYGLTVPDATFTVANSGDVLWTGFETIFHQNEQKQVHVEFSTGSSVTMAVYQPL